MKTAQIEVDLPMLINHCGKLRMLSHRFVMMLSLCQQGVPRKAEYFAAAQEALKGLKTTARYFVNPEAVIAVSYCANGTPLSDVLTDCSVFAPNMVAAKVFCSTVTFSILMLRVEIIMILTFTSFRA